MEWFQVLSIILATFTMYISITLRIDSLNKSLIKKRGRPKGSKNKRNK